MAAKPTIGTDKSGDHAYRDRMEPVQRRAKTRCPTVGKPVEGPDDLHALHIVDHPCCRLRLCALPVRREHRQPPARPEEDRHGKKDRDQRDHRRRPVRHDEKAKDGERQAKRCL